MSDPQATFAATLVDEWARAGVREAVVCPGSRSTPLALALATDGRIRVHVHHDERAGGFTALGVGLETGSPAVVLTTSGTAAVELHPAVVEAHQAGVPLLVCTADRPPELQDVGAPQTVDQTHLFGRSARWFAAPGVADPALAGTWRSLAARAVAESLGAGGGAPGPVHLDLAFRDPLVGDPGPLPPGRPGGAPWHEVRAGAAVGDGLVSRLAARCAGRRGVIVAGGGLGGAAGVHELAAVLGWPVLADPRSGCRTPVPTTVAAFDALLRVPAFAEAHRPEVVLRLGTPPASKVLAQWLAGLDAEQLAVDAHGRWFDPERTATDVVAAPPGELCGRLAEVLTAGPGGGSAPPGEGWLASWVAADAAARAAVDAVIDAHDEPTEPGVARDVVAGLPAGAHLVVASSMPVRDVEWYAAPRHGLAVHANRGANGIDGVVSTAVGVALAGGAPTAALVGDVAFLHDSNALVGLAARTLDLTVVVVDNRGGGIFEFLPQASLDRERFELLFGTPHDADLVSLARAHGVDVELLDRAAAVLPAVARSAGRGGVRVLVVRTDRRANVAVHDEIHAAVAAALPAA